jgi:hypothetical protein
VQDRDPDLEMRGRGEGGSCPCGPGDPLVFASPERRLRGAERVGRDRDRDRDMDRRFGEREVVMGRGGFGSGVARAMGCRMCLGLGRCWAFENPSPPVLESPERKDAFLTSYCVVQMQRRKGWRGGAWFLSSCCYQSLLCVCAGVGRFGDESSATREIKETCKREEESWSSLSNLSISSC